MIPLLLEVALGIGLAVGHQQDVHHHAANLVLQDMAVDDVQTDEVTNRFRVLASDKILQETKMTQVTAHMPETLVAELDAMAQRLNRSRAEVLRRAAEAYLDDCEDLRLATERLGDTNDPILEWDAVRRELVDPNQE